MMTVMQLIPAMNAGGAERSTLEISAALARAGHESLVVSAGGRLVPDLESAGARHIKLDLGAKSISAALRVLELRRLIRHYRPDVVHARSRMPAWIAYFAMLGLGRQRPRFVTTVHGLNSPGRYSRIMVGGERVVCVSETVREYVLEHYRGDFDHHRLRVIPRGIDPDEFPRGHAPDPGVRERLDLEYPQLKGRRLLLLPARGTRLKGHGCALKVLAHLTTVAQMDVALVMLGVREPGREDYVQELQQQAVRMGVADRLAMLPPRRDIRDLYALSSVVLQLSRQPEAFGRTVVEALSVGVPVVGFAHGGVGELLRELFPDGAVHGGDVEALQLRVISVLQAPPEVPPVERYRLQDMQAATLDLYGEVCGLTAGPLRSQAA